MDNRFYYLVMEYCSGGDMLSKIKDKKKFTEKDAAEVMI